MTPIDAKAQQILDEHTALKESIAAHNLRSALAESQMNAKCWRVAAIVGWICFIAQVICTVLRLTW